MGLKRGVFRALQSGSWNHRGLWGQAATCRALVPRVAGSWCEAGGVRPGRGPCVMSTCAPQTPGRPALCPPFGAVGS